MAERVLVTGSSGFVGGWVAQHLHSSGYEVFSLDLRAKETEGIVHMIGDITKPGSLDLPEVDFIVHCAGILESSHPSKEALRAVNIEGARNIFLRARESPEMKGFVFMSTISAIGPQGTKARPLTESTPLNPTDQYGWSKMKAEKILSDLSSKNGIPVWSLRPPVLYGEGMSPNSSGMKTFSNVRRGRMPLIGDGSNTFNFLYVGNLAHAIETLIIKNPPPGPYILNEGPYTQRDVIGAISSRMSLKKGYRKMSRTTLGLLTFLSGLAAPLIKGPPPLSKVKYQALTSNCWSIDHSKLENAIGYKPVYTLSQGVDRTCSHYGW